jgi:beta-lactamase superfamily II metal-dependent hydrolase
MIIKFLKAFNGDSILISFKDETSIYRNILIDGGTPNTYYGSGKKGNLFSALQDVKNRSQHIDLLILTHIDGDHIGGLKKWFEKDKDAFTLIKKVWFNSGKAIAKEFKDEENEELNEVLNIFDSTLTSVAQAIVFEDYIEKYNVWDKGIIQVGKIVDQNGVKIELLSPNNESLSKLLKEYKKPKHNYRTSSSTNDWNIPIEKFVNEEEKPEFKFIQDHSVSNGSSIAFILTFKDKRFLFLGDAHPSIVIDSLKNHGSSKEDPLNFEFVKLSHHGSSKNTNKELLDLIKTDNYIISTNSDVHNLPDKRTLARIINHNPNAVFYFNYDYVKKNIFLAEDMEKYKKFNFKNITEWI